MCVIVFLPPKMKTMKSATATLDDEFINTLPNMLTSNGP